MTYLIPKLDAVELIRVLQKLRSECCGDELSVTGQLEYHI